MTPSRAERLKLNVVLFVLAGAFVALGGRLYYLQVLCHDQHLAAAEAQTRMEIDLPAPRGQVVDCNYQPMALSVPSYVVAASLRDVADPQATAEKLAPLLGVAQDSLEEKLDQDQKVYVYLKRRVPLDVARAIEEAQKAERGEKGPRPLAGIVLLPDYRRTYVCGSLASHLLGFPNIDDKGQEGLERALNDTFEGRPGKWEMRRDGRARGISLSDENYQEPVPGCRAVLTIDLDVQRALEEQLEALGEKHTPVAAFGVVIDSQTGRVLALASWPSYDPNKPGASEAAARLNRVTATVMEPGSVFKPFIAAAALEEGLVSPNDMFFCENGAWHVGYRVITDAHGYGSLSFIDVVVKSSNIGMAKVGERLGAERMSRYCRAFGFGRATGLGLPGEAEGVLRPVKSWKRESVHSIAFGHEISVTPLQLAAAYAALANGGVLYRPQVLLRIEDPRGGTLREFPPQPMARVISERTSQAMREILKQVVDRGTGKLAHLEDFDVAGKTGTARKLVDGHYSSARHYSSFAGFAPADKPRLVAFIAVDEPQGAQYGGTVAAPAVAALLRTSLAHIGVEPKPAGPAVRTAGAR